jgi:hypothetical protein
MVTIAPSMASMLSNLGIAMISLDFSATFTCPSTRRWRAAKAETMWIGAMSPVLRPDRRTVLPSIAMTPSGRPVTEATQATKQCWNCSASSVAKMSPIRSCGGVPSLKGRKRRSRASFFSPKRAMSVKVSAPASVPNNASNSTSSSG